MIAYENSSRVIGSKKPKFEPMTSTRSDYPIKSPSSLQKSYLNHYTSKPKSRLGKDLQKSSPHAFDQPHWRMTAPVPNKNRTPHINSTFPKKNKDCQCNSKVSDKKPCHNPKSFYPHQPFVLPKGLHELSLRDLCKADLLPNISPQTSVITTDSFQVPGYVNMDNLPFEVGSIISDDATRTEYELINVLGEGTYAVVYLARSLLDDKIYALKCLSTHNLSQSQRDMQLQEIRLHKASSDSPNIVTLYNHFYYNSWLFLVLERVPGSDLYDYIMQHPTFGSSERQGHQLLRALKLYEQMLEAVSHIHSLKIYHRDLKPENFIVSPNGDLKLTDFGLATNESSSLNFECGSRPYMSYENRNGGLDVEKTIYGSPESYSPRLSDVWALGVLLFNLLFGESPWQDPSMDSCFKFADFVRDGSRFLSSQFPRLPKEVIDFLVQNVFCPEESRCSVLQLKLWVKCLIASLASKNINIPPPSRRFPSVPVNKKSPRIPSFNSSTSSTVVGKYASPPLPDSGEHTLVDKDAGGLDSFASAFSSSVPATVFSKYVSASKTAAILKAMPRNCNGAAAKSAVVALRTENQSSGPGSGLIINSQNSLTSKHKHHNSVRYFPQLSSSSYIPKPQSLSSNHNKKHYSFKSSSASRDDKTWKPHFSPLKEKSLSWADDFDDDTPEPSSSLTLESLSIRDDDSYNSDVFEME
ncbi:Negative regulator of sexual conjugation and meiosis [Smittium mucronatum]|uniref:Negative regulator of sexual conjugation and meiosis n=1 Tax=Smittium mucronatum TaxID=133383 RepID=A0A1R0H064_9FUNG|nr:Negative regulator of sexual conjugation and meiosis [Smittium mucronatum]